MFARAGIISYSKENDDLYVLRISLTWQDAWKNDINNDGVYIFAKYKSDHFEGYRTMKQYTASEGEYDGTDKMPDSCNIDNSNIKLGGYIPDNAVGMFIYPVEETKKENVCAEISVTVRAEYMPENIEIFAVEMVYVPRGPHYVGDPGNGISKGGTLKNCLYKYPDKGAYLISSEDALQFAPEENCLYCDADTPNGRQSDDRFEIPDEFPKGYNAVWYMKYNLTEAQFVQFLNCLSRKQQQSHCMSSLENEDIPDYYAVTGTNQPKDRCEVYCMRTGNLTDKPVKFYTAAPNRAMNAISYADVSAFACFAGLRPLTELEYEKACRGPLTAVKEEFAWGSTKCGRIFNFDGADGSGTENPVSQTEGAICNCNFGTDIAPFEKEFKTVPDNPGWVGPVSVGIFEKSEITEGCTVRECTGASYYGIMEMCGNVWENVISIGREAGRKYRPEHGTGELDENGQHTMSCWPDYKTGEGVGVRGGVFVSPNPGYLHMALRVFAAHTKNDKRYHGGVRVGY